MAFCDCLSKWVDKLNVFCAGKANGGDEEEGGEACCKMVTDTLREWVDPDDQKSFLQTLLCPVLDSDAFRKLKECKGLKVMAYAVGIMGLMVCMESFLARPWWAQLQACLGGADEDCGNSCCPPSWKGMLVFLYFKTLVLNMMGVITGLGLVYGLHCDKPDYVSMWLVWRAAVITLGVASLVGIFVYGHFGSGSLDMERCNEFNRLFVNLAIYLVVLAYSESDAEGEADDDDDDGASGGGVGAADDADVEAYSEVVGDEYMAAETKDALSSAIY